MSTTMVSKETMTLKLLVDKMNYRVVYAESDSNFVDVLLIFLTLPMGTIIRLSNKQSELGSMDNLYESVENIDKDYLNTEACKWMLLSPRMQDSAEANCRTLVINLDGPVHAKCLCGEIMDTTTTSVKPNADNVFVKEKKKFMITDDLNITPVSTANSLELLNQLRIKSPKAVEERKISVGRTEVLHLLKRSLFSKTPMTDVFLLKKEKRVEQTSCVWDLLRILGLPIEPTRIWDPVPKPIPEQVISDKGMKVESQIQTRSISLRILRSKSQNKVMYAEAKEDFLDLLFSFLTFPLGSIVKRFNGCSFLGSVDNLYKSVKSLSTKDNAILEERKHLLLEPKIASQFGISNQLLHIEELKAWYGLVPKCSNCFPSNKRRCLNAFGETRLRPINSKFKEPVTASGGGYAKEAFKFIVSDNLVMQPLSPISNMSFINNSGARFSDLYEEVVSVGELEALYLLRGSLTSDEVLSHVFCRAGCTKKPS